uniref:Uncharacterized protein n=1 Tax=Nonomuraea gerenzanensis TaxID=93944 RepID=A0A1M4EMG5_9ACTN|nr:hypothetical protein BN4615_P9547 [Nonomuraea gerenzanensis]
MRRGADDNRHRNFLTAERGFNMKAESKPVKKVSLQIRKLEKVETTSWRDGGG